MVEIYYKFKYLENWSSMLMILSFQKWIFIVLDSFIENGFPLNDYKNDVFLKELEETEVLILAVTKFISRPLNHIYKKIFSENKTLIQKWNEMLSPKEGHYLRV